ncbi:BirA family biotin operon repressor/biotin-[acetyl-CoA-carboxylase] ligase [Rhodopseudomonas rhenobacensis]|uniref:biotin--[biotin carboxyl-carrier protein] ligase n=1 Tax=Rhodopseudomonas rhenobacensis TaxID=87461 RepID=A0A7W7Z1W2_9BRAD|nr:biotin--[acetyl-CoA-carboxylase] ligase [Rhodopseudomonas rhenobacensis]MBB5046363.1 BirA family biotin operon repressor/biotin-[acetyl-CoA-carboxylase] ligase [Rhodopseudomonas rhenobacensis]
MALALGAEAVSAGYRVEVFDSIGSTNAEAMARARDGEAGPIWFVTTEQTAGRGRRQRPWIAPRGNLAASVLEVMDVAPGVAASLGFAAGLALQAALADLTAQSEIPLAIDYRLKWPNDVLAESQKLAGILLEAEAVADGRLAVVVGIGTNVVAAPSDTPYPATSLKALGLDVTAERLFAALSDHWASYRAIWDHGWGFAEIRRQWLQHAAGLGETVSIRSGASIVEGLFDSIDDTGCLIVRTPEGRQIPIAAGDVYFSATASAGAA